MCSILISNRMVSIYLACKCTRLIIVVLFFGRVLLTNEVLQLETLKELKVATPVFPYIAWESCGRQSCRPLKTLLKQLELGFSAIC